MASVLVQVFVGPNKFMEGKTVNVYDSYANALAHAATGLSTIQAMLPLTGAEGDAVSQTAKTAGLVADQNGMIHFFIEASTVCYLMSAGMWGPPRKVVAHSA
jgi:hypothetical protein